MNWYGMIFIVLPVQERWFEANRYPGGHLHSYEPTVLTHSALPVHGGVRSKHSFTSAQQGKQDQLLRNSIQNISNQTKHAEHYTSKSYCYHPSKSLSTLRQHVLTKTSLPGQNTIYPFISGSRNYQKPASPIWTSPVSTLLELVAKRTKSLVAPTMVSINVQNGPKMDQKSGGSSPWIPLISKQQF